MVTTRIISFHISSLSNFRLSILPSSVRCLIHCGISFSRVNSFRGTRIIHPSFAWIKQSIYICFRLSFFSHYIHRTIVELEVQKTFFCRLREIFEIWNFPFSRSSVSFLSFLSPSSHIYSSSSLISISNWSKSNDLENYASPRRLFLRFEFRMMEWWRL